MSTERDELFQLMIGRTTTKAVDRILAAGYRKIFDGDCGLSGINDPTDREAAEAWMRWANIVNTGGGEPNGIAAMKQMLTELGYRKHNTTPEATS